MTDMFIDVCLAITMVALAMTCVYLYGASRYQHAARLFDDARDCFQSGDTDTAQQLRDAARRAKPQGWFWDHLIR